MLIAAVVIGAMVATSQAHADHVGTVTFPTSCSAAAQPTIERGVALLHSFQYQEAAQAFESAAHLDQACAMCHWGTAMTVYHQLWEWPSADAMQVGQRAIALAQQVGGKTDRERGYIAATAVFFQAPANITHVARIELYARQLGALRRRVPQDTEVAAFYALSRVALAEARGGDRAMLRQAIAILNPLFQQHPDHPGVAHYLIHAADRPELARLGLDAARRYADIAPDSSHALHMPSHLFVRLGLWEETIALNLRAAASGARAAREHRAGYIYESHAKDYLRYAYAQRGLESKARAIEREVDEGVGASDQEKAGDHAYFAAYTAVELHRWEEAAALPILDLPPDWLTDTFWGRTIGAARIGDVRAAHENLERLRTSVQAARAHQDAGAHGADEMPIYQAQAEAVVAFAEGRTAHAADMLRKAAAREEAKGAESLGVPAREILADLLLELLRPDEALRAYQAVLKQAPNRFNALLGAARAADAGGSPKQARDFYQQLLTVAAPEADRPEIAIARVLLAR